MSQYDNVQNTRYNTVEKIVQLQFPLYSTEQEI